MAVGECPRLDPRPSAIRLYNSRLDPTSLTLQVFRKSRRPSSWSRFQDSVIGRISGLPRDPCHQWTRVSGLALVSGSL